MSPLVQRPRAQNSQSNPTDQHWSMLLFESLSAGVAAVFVGFTLVLAVVGVYVIIVWPLTFWDLANTGLENYAGWLQRRCLQGKAGTKSSAPGNPQREKYASVSKSIPPL
jgi:hypothetical protein